MKSHTHFEIDSKRTVRVVDKRPSGYQFYGLSPLPEEFMLKTPLESAETARFLEERRAFAIAAQAIREEEKARLARELHDELAQSLTALKMDTIWVRDHTSFVPGMVTAKLTEMVEMLDRTVAATRRMAADLRPLMLDDLGLVPAIEWLASSFIERCGVPCALLINDELDLELPEPYATAVFRIVQESLNNIAKHAAASQVMVTLDKTLDTVRLRVQDDGCGFFSDGMRKPQSLGLLGLRERAQLLGGNVAIRSVRGKGTTVEVSIPLNQIGAH
ncbi:sensor histidine kinase [Polaromonas sp. CG_9.11]|uniref:sensor histidine kinase n=1 Tax=Polaromonas sp. CG_9.11 TaxID=2787730 RepID=UPI0018C8E58F|nr:sensor histidine kinase [Polaromonas sp. CG_9.11]MBG6074902.1 signal transduction histidine kinase [Polaromonas sp. CG_9.11]